MKTTTGIFIFTVLVIAVTDIAAFYHLYHNPAELSAAWAALVILITIVPIVIANLVYARRKR